MGPKQDEPVEEADDDDSSEGIAGLIWVPKKLLEDVTAKLEKKEEVSKESVEQLIAADEPADDVPMVPVDMSECAEIEDEENLVEKLGATKVAELFVKGRKTFLEGVAKLPEEAKANVRQEMTGAEYKKMLAEEMAQFEECGESELEDEEDEEEDAEEEEGDEPPAKKAKQS